MGLFDIFKKKTTTNKTVFDRSHDYENAFLINDLTSVELLILESINISIPNTDFSKDHIVNSEIISSKVDGLNLSNYDRQYIYEGLYNTGNEMQRRNKDDFAIEIYERALYYSRNPSAINNMALSMKKLGKIHECVGLYFQSTVEFPNYTNGYLRYLKVGLANNTIVANSCFDMLDDYFMYGGTFENLEYYINDPSANLKERIELKEFYDKWKAKRNRN